MRKVTKKGKDNLDTTGKRIAYKRTEIGMSQEELAEKLYTNREKINRIEKGTRPLSIEDLKKFADIFNVPTDYLLCRTENKNVDNIEIGKKLGLDDLVLDILEDCSQDVFKKYAINKFLSDDGYMIPLLTEYFIISVIEEIINSDDNLKLYYENKYKEYEDSKEIDFLKLNPDAELTYARIMSHLPLLRESIKQTLLNGDYVSWFFKYLDFMDEAIQDNLDSNKLAEPYLDNINEMFKKERENHNKKISAYLKSDSYKKLDELYKKHTEKK